jgi:hypothetical protein
VISIQQENRIEALCLARSLDALECRLAAAEWMASFLALSIEASNWELDRQLRLDALRFAFGSGSAPDENREALAQRAYDFLKGSADD